MCEIQGNAIVCGKTTDKECPKAEECCGNRLEGEYGICNYGFGVFDRCMTCFTVYNFCETD